MGGKTESLSHFPSKTLLLQSRFCFVFFYVKLCSIRNLGSVKGLACLTHDVYSFIWCWLLWEPEACPFQKHS